MIVARGGSQLLTCISYHHQAKQNNTGILPCVIFHNRGSALHAKKNWKLKFYLALWTSFSCLIFFFFVAFTWCERCYLRIAISMSCLNAETSPSKYLAFILADNNQPEVCFVFPLDRVDACLSSRFVFRLRAAAAATVGVYLSRYGTSFTKRASWIIYSFKQQTAKDYLHGPAMGMSGAGVEERGGFKFPFRLSSFFWFEASGTPEKSRAAFTVTEIKVHIGFRTAEITTHGFVWVCSYFWRVFFGFPGELGVADWKAAPRVGTDHWSWS